MPPLQLYIVCLLGAVGVYLVIRPGGLARLKARPVTAAGATLGLLGLGVLILRLAGSLGDAAGAGAGGFHATFTLIAVAAAVAMITTSRPVYAALYFVLVVLSSAALFLLMEAEFMAFALIIVYAGAILITYMFVLMLAQQSPDPEHPEAQAEYDLNAREPLAGAIVGFILLALLSRMVYDGTAQITPGDPAAARVAAWQSLESMPQRAVDYAREAVRDAQKEQGASGDPGTQIADVNDIELLRDDEGKPRIEIAADGSRALVWTVWPDGSEHPVQLPQLARPENTQEVGLALVADFPASLEVAGVILLMAMFGAVILARRQIELSEDETREAAGLRRLGHHDDLEPVASGRGLRGGGA